LLTSGPVGKHRIDNRGLLRSTRLPLGFNIRSKMSRTCVSVRVFVSSLHPCLATNTRPAYDPEDWDRRVVEVLCKRTEQLKCAGQAKPSMD
jgi:hypothetical protein